MFSIRKLLMACLCVPVIAFAAAEDVRKEPLNMFVISQYGAANKVATDELKSALCERNQNFVILCDDSIIKCQLGFAEAMAAACDWSYFHNNILHFVLCIGNQERRSLDEMGFDASLWTEIKNIFSVEMGSRNASNFAGSFSQLFKDDGKPQNFFLFMLGHGTSSYIAGMPTTEYKEFQSVLETMGTRFLGIESCYAGGINSQVSVNELSRPTFPIAIYCAGDVIGLGDCSISLSRLFSNLNEQWQNHGHAYHEQELVGIIKNSYKEKPYLFNLPILYVPGNQFFNAVAITDVVAINEDDHTAIAIPANCRAVQVKTPSLQGAIIDHSSPYILPFVSRVPGNATHELSALFRHKATMSAVINSFFPTTFLIHKSSGSRFEAIKLWLLHDLIALDRQFAGCAIWFDGTDTHQKAMVLAQDEQGLYGMVQINLSAKGITDAELSDAWIPLDRLEYARLIMHLCASATIDQKVVRAMGLQDVNPEQVATRFLQLEGFDIVALAEAKKIDVESILNKNLFIKICALARRIKVAEDQKDFHSLWHIYGELDQFVNANKDIAPSVIAALFAQGYEQVALFCAQWLNSEVAKQAALLCEGRHKALLENLFSPEKVSCSLLPDVIDPILHLHCITVPQHDEDRFLQALSAMLAEKRYEELFAILVNLLTKHHELTPADNFLLQNQTLRCRASHIMRLIKGNPACYDAFCEMLIKLLNSADVADREQAKVLITRVSILPGRLLGIVQAMTTDSAIREGKFLCALLEKELMDNRPVKHSLFTVLANKVDEYYKYADWFDGYKIRDLFHRLPFSCKPLGHRIRDEKGGTIEGERSLLAEYEQQIFTNPHEAAQNYVMMIPREYSYSCRHELTSAVLHQRIQGLTTAILTSTNWRMMLDQIMAIVHGYSDSEKSITYLVEQYGSGEQQNAIKEWLQAHGK